MAEKKFVSFHFLNLVIECTCVFNLLLIRQWFGHIIVPTLRTERRLDQKNSKTTPPYDMVGEVREGCLLIASPVGTSYLSIV